MGTDGSGRISSYSQSSHEHAWKRMRILGRCQVLDEGRVGVSKWMQFLSEMSRQAAKAAESNVIGFKTTRQHVTQRFVYAFVCK